MPRIRKATHAGSWYEGDACTLAAQIEAWMATARAARTAAAAGDAAATTANGAEASYATSTTGRRLASRPTRALIGPHAGYSYCGHVLAHAYAGVEPERVARAIVLGPSHHVYSKEATISGADAAETPLGALTIDAATRAALLETGAFAPTPTPHAADEAEHSLELHLPFLAAALGAKPGSPTPIPVTLIMVGALPPAAEAAAAAALAPHLADPATLCVVSSDFCHWGSRFGYTWTQPGGAPTLADGIEALDREGMALIDAQDGPGFRAYLARTGNTVCGRHPISLFLATLAACREEVEHEVQFVAYDQSSRCVGPRDSSVSYASAVVAVKEG